MSPDAAVEAAVRRVTAHAGFGSSFRHPVKFNGTDFVEMRLSPEEQTAEVSKLAREKLHVFLERYGSVLEEEDLLALKETTVVRDSPEAQIWLEKLLRKPDSESTRTKRARRRRWEWARQEMAQSEGYFSEDVMKRRDPELFHRLIGRDADPAERLNAPMRGGLSTYLLEQLERDCEAEGLPASSTLAASDLVTGSGGPHAPQTAGSATGAKGGESASMDVDAADGSEGGDSDAGGEDVAAKRARFFKVMRDRFVNGDEDFNYKSVDGDSDLDDLTEMGRDAEERYFDEV